MIVLDCSAAVNMVLGTREGKALAALALYGERIIAPRLFCAELVHTFVKYAKADWFSFEAAFERMHYAFGLIDEYCDDDELTTEVLSESVRLRHSSHDMFYFILARRTRAMLFTLDKHLAALCEREGINCVHEIRA